MGYTREIETVEVTDELVISVQIESMPGLLVDASAVSYNNEVYVFGGFDFGPKSFQGIYSNSPDRPSDNTVVTPNKASFSVGETVA